MALREKNINYNNSNLEQLITKISTNIRYFQIYVTWLKIGNAPMLKKSNLKIGIKSQRSYQLNGREKKYFNGEIEKI